MLPEQLRQPLATRLDDMQGDFHIATVRSFMRRVNLIVERTAEFRVARSSRAMVLASPQDELSFRNTTELAHVFGSDTAGRFAKAGRLRQRSGQACYLDSIARLLEIVPDAGPPVA